MSAFLQHLIRFVEPLVSGVLALAMIAWLWWDRVRDAFEVYGWRRAVEPLRPVYAIVAFAAAMALGTALEQASSGLMEVTQIHPLLIQHEYDPKDGRIDICTVCKDTPLCAAHYERRETYGPLYLLPEADKGERRIEGLVAERTYFANNLVRTTALTMLIGTASWIYQAWRLKRRDEKAVRKHPVRQRALRRRARWSFAGFLLAGTGYVGAESAYHHSVRYAVIATALSRPDICKPAASSVPPASGTAPNPAASATNPPSAVPPSTAPTGSTQAP